jgi:toxin HigB-1
MGGDVNREVRDWPLQKLRGNLAGFHSIRVNTQWRLIFRWDGSRGEAESVYLHDPSDR